MSDNEEPTTEPAPTGHAVEVARPVDTVSIYEDRLLELAIDDPEEVSRAIVERILTETDPMKLYGQSEVDKSRAMLGVPLEILGVRWMRSGIADGPAVYAIIEAMVRDTGEKATISCGAASVKAVLYQWQQMDAFPMPGVLKQSDKPTASGFYPMWIDLPPGPEEPFA